MQMKAYRQGSAKGTKVERYASLDALTQIRTDVDRLKESRTVVRGDVGHEPEVTALDMDAEIPTTTLSDCVDLSKYQTYDTVAKKVIPLPPEQPLRYVMTVNAERWDSGWMVTRVTPEDGPEC
ncbi:hypothetical protein [Streptomyces sp. NPDC060322]|uniref:hypothetical protein n=1 Tax=Streptomyces sp. NPDC060322 TaxID=3347097 RepID=UPI003665E5BB